MSFDTEPKHYQKTALADLKGAWECLRSTLVDAGDVENRERLLFHVDEAMSWECVRDLNSMQTRLTLIRNIAMQSNVSPDIQEWIEAVGANLNEVYAAISAGETR